MIWVGFAPNVRYILTFCILTDDTHHIIYCSTICSTLILQEKNLHLEFSKGEDDPHRPVKQVFHTWDIESDEYETPTFSPLKPVIGCTFLTTLIEDGQCFCTHIIHHIKEIDDATDKVCARFLVHKSEDERDEIMGYHELLESLEEQHGHKLEIDTCWQFKQITGPQVPLNEGDSNYEGCNYDVRMGKWLNHT